MNTKDMSTKELGEELGKVFFNSKLAEVAKQIGESKARTLVLAKDMSGDIEGGCLYATLLHISNMETKSRYYEKMESEIENNRYLYYSV